MKYFKVKPEFNGLPKDMTVPVSESDKLVGNELYTKREMKQMPYVYDGAFTTVRLPKKRTKIVRSSRFEIKE